MLWQFTATVAWLTTDVPGYAAIVDQRQFCRIRRTNLAVYVALVRSCDETCVGFSKQHLARHAARENVRF